MKNILDYIEQVKEMYNDQEPRNMQLAKANDIPEAFDPDLEQSEFLKKGETLEDWKPNPFLKPHADGGRAGYKYAGVVKHGPNTGKHKYTDFYPKKTNGSFHKWFDSKKEMNEALQQRKEASGKGLSQTELTSKYKKFLKNEGYKTWAEASKEAKSRMKTALYLEQNPKPSIAKWKDEGLTTRVNEKTRKLLETKKPINQRTGLPYTLKEFTALSAGQKNKLLRRLEGKVAPRPWAKRQGWYPEKKANKLMTYLKHAAKKQESLPLKERNFINVWEGEKFVGVKDVRKNTLWTHVDYDLTGKKGKVITKHPGNKNVQFFLKQAEKFKYGAPDELLGSYFSKYQRVPKYSEMYTFFTVDPQSVGAKSGKAYKINPLQQHHQELMAKEPARSIQLALPKQNTEASRILNQFEKGNYSFAEANKRLNEIGVRIKSSKGWLGPAKGEITAAKSIEAAQAETIKMFKEAHKNNPKIVDQMTKALNIAKKAKGPGRLKALGTLITLGGTGFVTALGFNSTEVQAAEAQAAETGVAVNKLSDLSFKEKAVGTGAAVGVDILKNKAKISKRLAKGAWKWLPLTWTPAGDVALHKLFSDKEPELVDFAEGLKEAGYDINSEEFQNQWNSISKDERKEILYDWAGKVIDKRSTGEKALEAAESPWTHMTYAFWKPGVESMKKALKYNPGNKTLAKKWALRLIRMGVPMKVISAANPVGWALTAGTTGYKLKNWAEENLDWNSLTQEQRTDIQERKTAVPKMLDTYEQASKLAKDQGISYEDALKQLNKPNVPGINFIDFSLPKPIETLAGGGMVGIRKPSALPPTGGPQSGGLPSLYNNDRKL